MLEFSREGQWLLVVLAPIVAAGLTKGLMLFAPRWGLIDHPGHRKVHDHPTPLVGGLAVLLTLVALQAATGSVPFGSWSLLAALLLVTTIGVADDSHELSHRAKFVAQALGAIIIVSGTSVWVTNLGDLTGLGAIELGKWSLMVTVISFVGVMNAINMIDGLDGLSGSVSLVPVVLLGYLAMAGNSQDLLFELLLFAGAILGFLSLNFRLPGRSKALVFMGDTGRHGDRHAARLVLRQTGWFTDIADSSDYGGMDSGGAPARHGERHAAALASTQESFPCGSTTYAPCLVEGGVLGQSGRGDHGRVFSHLWRDRHCGRAQRRA